MSPLTLREAADELGVSVRTLQRRRSALIAAGATHGPSGWSISPEALDALREGATGVAPVAPSLSPPVTPSSHDAQADDAQAESNDDSGHVSTDREALADARARVEMLERERGDLIRRAEAAEATAQQATAAAAALALRMRELEVGAAAAETTSQERSDDQKTHSETGQSDSWGGGTQASPEGRAVRSRWERVQGVFRR